MKKGLHMGSSTFLTDTVTQDMVAQFGGEVVHPVYSTVAMVYHMEWTSRLLVLPFLDENEEGMGAEVSVKHIAPTGLGTQVNITATVTDMTDHKVITEVLIENEQGLIGRGEVKQAILPKKTVELKVKKSMNE
ncbi:thioesterase family protein [Lentibacillus halophilus]|uniref:Thioesterase family protein n=1 Tax=Lentibacillus halophilus TaxID=295065 RepID=A0ABN0Z9L0_9BACI